MLLPVEIASYWPSKRISRTSADRATSYRPRTNLATQLHSVRFWPFSGYPPTLSYSFPPPLLLPATELPKPIMHLRPTFLGGQYLQEEFLFWLIAGWISPTDSLLTAQNARSKNKGFTAVGLYCYGYCHVRFCRLLWPNGDSRTRQRDRLYPLPMLSMADYRPGIIWP